MNRTASRLLHDYKHAESTKVPKTRKLQWFAVGLGLPLVGLMLILFFRNDTSASPPAIGYELSEIVVKAEPALPDLRAELAPITLASTAPLPRMQAVPEYDLLEFEIHSGDTLDRLFRRHDLDLGNLAAIVKLPEAGKYLKMLRPGDEFMIRHDGGQLVSLYRDLDLTHSLRVSRGDSGYVAEIIERPIETHKRLAYGRIESSLFESAAAAGLPDKLIMSLAGIFAWDIDFVLDIRKGDDYYILYDEIYQDGKFVTAGDIVAAEFNNNGRTFRAVRYVDAEGHADYFTPEGLSVRKAFIRAPVDFTRISSAFNPHRRHPILNTIRAHQGVDYAAPTGTPIKAAGDGKIIFRGRKGGYGNCIVIQHGGNITTLYAHMSRFEKSVGLNDRVRQGDVIGYVGHTGLATASHLHYEYRVNGVHRNPRTVELPQADPIKAEYRADFLAKAGPILDELQQYKRTQVASARTVHE
ncbi:MAG TPA: peptidoglycan DD-metalloendopeptidase family protein [Woeseiaceae bacterium]|nr:peptidoglycan DD-metalloendopeptidase family protein [Woeseiaceae bacterium]